MVEDVKKLNNFLLGRARKLRSEVESGKLNQYSELTQVCLAQVFLFNRCRIGEAEGMLMSAYCDALKGSEKPDSAILSMLNEFERRLCLTHFRVEIMGKEGEIVPVLFTPEMKKSVDVLVKVRQETSISEPYLFARPGSNSKPYTGEDCIRKFSKLALLQNPIAITSTKLKNQLGTIAQVLNLGKNSQDILDTFQSHNINVPRKFYQLLEITLQVAKVSKILHGINNGTVNRYKGMDFNQIDFAFKGLLHIILSLSILSFYLT
jgi:hypothetical protein